MIDQAVEVVCCQELFCAVCICNWLQTHNECPVCLHNMKASELKRPHKILCRIVGNWSLISNFYQTALESCPVIVLLPDLQQHTNTCPFNEASSSKSIANRTVRPQSIPMRSPTPSPYLSSMPKISLPT